MQNKIILKVRAGSHLYGLNTPTSDEDYIGVYLNTPEEILGLQNSEIVEENVVSKQDNGRNNQDAIDCKYYSLKKFCTLALSANPTILELLFANDENILELDEYGAKLLAHRDLFLSQRIKHTYLGYAHSQVAKSQVKSENLRILVKARDLLKKENPTKMLYKLCEEHGLHDNELLGIKGGYLDPRNGIIRINGDYPDYVTIADVKFNNRKIKDVVKIIEERLDKASHRADGMLEHGLDYKFVSHTIRLIKEGQELLETGTLKFPLKDRDLLMDIKLGKYKPTEVMDMIGDLESVKDEWGQYNLLPHSADFKAINKLVIDIHKEYLLNSYYTIKERHG